MEVLPGGLTFCRSVCSCFSITSSWYTLPVRSRGSSSLDRQGTGSGPSHPWGSGESRSCCSPEGAWRRSSGGSQKPALLLARSTREGTARMGWEPWERRACGRLCAPALKRPSLEDGPRVCLGRNSSYVCMWHETKNPARRHP